MALFSFGGSKSKSQSSSLDLGYGYSGSGSESGSFGESSSVSGGRSSQRIAFEDIFAELYGNASGAAGRVAQLAPALTDQANMLFSGGLGFLDALGGGSEFLESRVSGESPVLQQQIDALGADLGEFFREELNPTITGEAVATGTLGGGRQGVAQAEAAEQVAQEFQRGVVGLRTADVAARDSAARALLQSRISGAGVGLSALPGLFGVAQGGFGAELAPYTALAGILGGPTTLTESEQFGRASSTDIARAISQAFGEDFRYGKSQSSSSSKSFNFGLGGGVGTS